MVALTSAGTMHRLFLVSLCMGMGHGFLPQSRPVFPRNRQDATSKSSLGNKRHYIPVNFLASASLRLYAKRNTNIRKDSEAAGDGEVGYGPNWIERSFPVDIGGKDDSSTSASELKKVEDYNLGISGVSFQTGSLSKRKYRKENLRL